MIDVYIVLGVGVMVVVICQLIVLVDQFGVIDFDLKNFEKIVVFCEKLKDVVGFVDFLYEVFVLMGNYVFDVDVLIDVVQCDGVWVDFNYDMGGDIVFDFVVCGEVGVYDFNCNEVFGVIECDCFYWCDVGMIELFFDVYQDLILVFLVFNFYNCEWLIFSQ